MPKGIGYAHAMPTRSLKEARRLVGFVREALHLFEPIHKSEERLLLKLKRAIKRFEEADNGR